MSVDDTRPQNPREVDLWCAVYVSVVGRVQSLEAIRFARKAVYDLRLELGLSPENCFTAGRAALSKRDCENEQ